MRSNTQSSRLAIVTPTHSARAGGSEYQIDCFIGVLSSLQRYEIFYLSGLVADEPPTNRYKVIRVGHDTSAPRFGYLTQAVPLYHALREIEPHAIYQRVACGYTGVCAYYARRHNTRLVWHVAHDSDVTPDASLDGRNPVRRFLEKRSVEYGIRRASCIVTQTGDQARLLEHNYRRKADAIIPNFQPLPHEAIDKSGELTVVWIAGIKPWKRPEVFLSLADSMRDLPAVRFVMVGAEGVGRGEKPWVEALMRRIRSTPNLRYLGGRSQSEVNELLARSHVFVNTSRHEGFPNTFIQAWMRDVAVVSLHVDPDRQLEEQRVGIFCGGSEERLFEAVRALVTDRPLREDFGSRSRAYAVARHSMANATGLARLLETGTVQ